MPENSSGDRPGRTPDADVLDYLSGSIGVEAVREQPGGLDADEIAELDDLRALLADPNLWVEPRPELEDAVVDAVVAESATLPSITAAPGESAGRSATAPADLGAARDRRQRRRGGRQKGAWLAVAATVAAMVAGVVFLVSGPNDSTTTQFQVALAGTELAPTASGHATMLKTQSGWKIELDATGLPRLDKGRYYQAWLKNADGVLVPIGTFNEGAQVILWAGVPPGSFPTMTITREQADNHQESSGERVLVGTAIPAG